MSKLINLEDYQCIDQQGYLQKWCNIKDSSRYSVRKLTLDNSFKPEAHPILVSTEKLSSLNHHAFPIYFGYGLRKMNQETEILIFLESCQGSLQEILTNIPLQKEELKSLLSDVIDAVIHFDRNAYITPSYLTLNNILVCDSISGKRKFKIFGIVNHDDDKQIPAQDLRWTSPELYERKQFRKIHININPEKALLYSIGILFTHCATEGEFISEGREIYQSGEFPLKNSQRESEATQRVLAIINTNYREASFQDQLQKLLIYNVQQRPDFRILELSQRNELNNKKNIKNQKLPQSSSKPSSPLDIEIGNTNNSKKKNACCNIF